MIRLVLFDIDGTLIQTGDAGMRAFNRAFDMGFGITEAAAGMDFAGRTDRGILLEFFTRHEIEPSDEHHAVFFRLYVHWLEHFLNDNRGETLPGVASLLRDLLGLPNRPAIGLLTGNIRLGAQIKLRHHRLWNFFETGAFGCEHHDRNNIARIALDRGRRFLDRRLRGEEILVIGDTTRDIDCANTIGARCLAVATGGGGLEELRAHAPTWSVSSLAHVTAREICA